MIMHETHRLTGVLIPDRLWIWAHTRIFHSPLKVDVSMISQCVPQVVGTIPVPVPVRNTNCVVIQDL